jgi:hypothetical protein
MVATSSLYKEELCPICREFVTTYTQKDDAPLPLNTDVAAAVRGISHAMRACNKK